MIKKYSFGALIVVWTLIFFGIAPGLVSGMGGDFYIGVLLVLAYPLSMYYLVKHFIKILKTDSKG